MSNGIGKAELLDHAKTHGGWAFAHRAILRRRDLSEPVVLDEVLCNDRTDGREDVSHHSLAGGSHRHPLWYNVVIHLGNR